MIRGQALTRQFRLYIHPDSGPITEAVINADLVQASRQIDNDEGVSEVVRQLSADQRFQRLDFDSPTARYNLRSAMPHLGTLRNIAPDVLGVAVHIPGAIPGDSGADSVATQDIQRVNDAWKAQLENERASFQRERDAYNAQIRQMQANSAAKPSAAIQQYQQQISSLNRQVSTLTGERDVAKAQLATMSDALQRTQQKMQDELADMNTALTHEQFEKSQLQSQLTAAQEDIARLRTHQTSSQRDLGTLKQENDRLRRENSELKARFAAQTSGMANTGEQSHEPIPML